MSLVRAHAPVTANTRAECGTVSRHELAASLQCGSVAEYPLYLHPFRFRDSLTDKWRKARYRAELHEIRERYSEFELDGEPMVIKGPITGTSTRPRGSSSASSGLSPGSPIPTALLI